MDKVYVVTAGCYDDYRMEAIFSDEEKANEFKRVFDEKRGLDDRRVESVFVDIPLEEYVISGTYSYSIHAITYKNMMFLPIFPMDKWNVRDRDLFCFAVKYDKKYDDEEVLLADVRELAKEWE